MRILLAEPDVREREAIREVLLQAGYEVRLAEGTEDTAALPECAAVIAAVRLPWGESAELVRRLRQSGFAEPLLLLANTDERDCGAAGLDAGADDFLVKPAPASELLARLRARFRCRAGERKRILRVEDLELDMATRRVSRQGQRIDLTPRQFNVLEVLMLESPNPVSKLKIVQQVWGEAMPAGTNVVNVVINQLRNRINRPDSPALLHTIRGVGFVFRKQTE